MANPLIGQGTLNRLKASVVFNDYPQLNVTSSFLMPEAIDWMPEGNVTAALPSLTGYVPSPEPYQMARVAIHLVRSQAFANQWKQQIENNSLLGDATIRPDTATMDPWTLNNVSITSMERMGFGGRDAGFTVNLQGTWNINLALWN